MNKAFEKKLGNEGIENNLKRPCRGVQYDLKLNHASDQENKCGRKVSVEIWKLRSVIVSIGR